MRRRAWFRWRCALGGGGAGGLFAGVEDLQGEDGEPVDDEAGCLGVEGRCSVLWGDGGEEPGVHLFDEVVALLVEAIDGVLDAGDLGVGGGRVAGLVFLVPEVEVGAVLAQEKLGEGGEGRVRQAVSVRRAGCYASRSVVSSCRRMVV